MGNEFYRAQVRVSIGMRLVNKFMRAADLGVAGVGADKILTIDYKPGEHVDEARVNKAIDDMRVTADTQNTEFEIMGHRIIWLRLIKSSNA